MEDDRSQTNLGADISSDLKSEPAAATRQPKKRFIGRRQAAENASKTTANGVNVEDSGAIQGE